MLQQTPVVETIAQFKANCTLVAVQNVSGKTDAEVIAAFRCHNYKNHKGMFDYQYMSAARDLGVSFRNVDGLLAEELTLKQFCKAYPTGTYIVRTPGHALVVRQGQVIDPNYRRQGLKRRVKGAYHILNAAPFKMDSLKLTRADLSRKIRIHIEWHQLPKKNGKFGTAYMGVALYILRTAKVVTENGKTALEAVTLEQLIAGVPEFTYKDAKRAIKRGYLKFVD